MNATARSVDRPQEPPPGKLTYEEFLDWCDEDTLAEWIDGEVVVASPASRPHQDLAAFLTAFLRIVAEQDELGVVISAPFQMRLRSLQRGREPDVMFVSKEHLDRLTANYLDGPADLVIEITSPESFARDRGEKFIEYERAGVPEYWLIDRERRHAELYQLDDGGRYRLAFEGERGEYRGRAPSRFRIRVEWLWQDPLPKVLTALRELELI